MILWTRDVAEGISCRGARRSGEAYLISGTRTVSEYADWSKAAGVKSPEVGFPVVSKLIAPILNGSIRFFERPRVTKGT